MSEERHGRRAFFKEAVRRWIEPAVDYLDERARTERPVILRPPGAISEASFLDTCERCNACVAACPADAIRPIGGEGRLKGTPGIVAAEQPCVVCDGLDCMPACPSGALVVVTADRIDLGTAVVDQAVCVRSAGEDCRVCVERCPIGDRALVIDQESRIAVVDGCVGCGVCEHSCPTTPKAITVSPKEPILA